MQERSLEPVDSGRALSERERAVMDRIREIAAAELTLAPVLQPDDDLVATLELDSLTRLTLLVAIEDRFQVALSDAALAKVRTLADLSRLVARQTEGTP
jgi:acyl carrier protein